MTLAVLEINDVELAIGTAEGRFHSEPGFAHLAEQGIETGEVARARAFTEPQATFNQYWLQLGENPLAVRSPRARHHADIAFAQLDHMLDLVGPVDRCVLAIPASLGNAQLSLLLGMLDVLGVKTLAVVDSALAARLGEGTPGLHLDMHLHHSIVSRLELVGDNLSVTRQQVIAELGLVRLHNQVARLVADRMIETTRFDPLHDPGSQQWLHDQLPHWLAQLQWQGELQLLVPTPLGEQSLRLGRDEVAAKLAARLAPLDGFLADSGDQPLVLSHGAAVLAGLAPALAGAQVLGVSTAVDNCLAHLPLTGNDGDLRRLAAVPVDTGAVTAGPPPPADLYLLHGHRAWPLSRPLSISAEGEGLRMAQGIDPRAAVTLVQRGEELEVLQRDGGSPLELPRPAHAGATLVIRGHRLTLIEVGREG